MAVRTKLPLVSGKARSARSFTLMPAYAATEWPCLPARPLRFASDIPWLISLPMHGRYTHTSPARVIARVRPLLTAMRATARNGALPDACCGRLRIEGSTVGSPASHAPDHASSSDPHDSLSFPSFPRRCMGTSGSSPINRSLYNTEFTITGRRSPRILLGAGESESRPTVTPRLTR